MQADKDDMPEYVRSRKEERPWRTLAIIGIGSAITTTVILIFGKPIVIDVSKVKEAIHVGGKPVLQQQKVAKDYRVVERLEDPVKNPVYEGRGERKRQNNYSAEDVVIRPERKVISNDAVQKKQTVFNDRNYTPRGAGNVIALNDSRVTNEESEGIKITVIGKERRLKDYCDWLSSGSIERRECRMKTDLGERNRSYTGNRAP